MFAKYFHTLYLLGCYPPDGCGGVIVLSLALFLHLRTLGLGEVTPLLDPTELVSHRTGAGNPGDSCSFHGSSCIWGVVWPRDDFCFLPCWGRAHVPSTVLSLHTCHWSMFSLISPLRCRQWSGSPECSLETFFCQYLLNLQSSSFPTDHWGSSSASDFLAVFSPPVSPFFFLGILHTTQLTVGLCPILRCHKPSDTLTHSTKEKAGRGATLPKVNQMFFMLLKHFLSTSNIQSTVQKLPEVGGGLGSITAFLTADPQARVGRWLAHSPPASERRVWSQTAHHRNRICSLSLAGARRPASS